MAHDLLETILTLAWPAAVVLIAIARTRYLHREVDQLQERLQKATEEYTRWVTALVTSDQHRLPDSKPSYSYDSIIYSPGRRPLPKAQVIPLRRPRWLSLWRWPGG